MIITTHRNALLICNYGNACSKEEILIREQYYLDEIKPEYNINLKAGSNLGRTYSEEVRQNELC